jgi:hypothetical protein
MAIVLVALIISVAAIASTYLARPRKLGGRDH